MKSNVNLYPEFSDRALKPDLPCPPFFSHAKKALHIIQTSLLNSNFFPYAKTERHRLNSLSGNAPKLSSKFNLTNVQFQYFKGLYKKEKHNLILKILSGKKKDGTIIAFNIAFNLTQLSMI